MTVSITKAEYNTFKSYIATSLTSLKSFDIITLFSPTRFISFLFDVLYIFIQYFIIATFRPIPPGNEKQPTSPKGRIAIIGAGLTGISSASHAIAHGFDVVIFEKGDKIGGIWTHVNSTSGLQLNSMLYRFHPGVLWTRAFPLRDEILSEVERIWKEYCLDTRTRFSYPVTSIRPASSSDLPGITEEDLDPKEQGHHRWIINDGSEGVFDAVIVTVGTCGKPRWVKFEGMPTGIGEERHKIKRQGAEKGKHHTKEAKEDKEDKASTPQNPPSPVTDQKHSAWAQGPPESLFSHEEVHQIEEVKKANEGPFPTPGEAYPTSAERDPQLGTRRLSSASSTTSRFQAEGAERYEGLILHSSQLDRLKHSRRERKKKRVVVVGSGASGVEAVEMVLSEEGFGAEEEMEVEVVMIARQDKWIIPRNIFLDTLIAAQPFGREMPLSFLWEKTITMLNYRGVEDLVPARLGIFEGTPIVNDDFLNHVRSGKCRYIRGDVERLTKSGVRVSVRGRESAPGDIGKIEEFDADVVILATGYEKPDIGFLEGGLFPEGYERPNLYLQNFSTEDWSVLLTNSSYMNAIGTVGHFHIGIYTRILLTLLMDKNSRPTPKDMKLWVDAVGFLKKGAKGGAFGFFTYMELTIWLVLFHIFRPDRIRWMFFIMQGWGVSPK